jgi:hypothetical protein
MTKINVVRAQAKNKKSDPVSSKKNDITFFFLLFYFS